MVEIDSSLTPCLYGIFIGFKIWIKGRINPVCKYANYNFFKYYIYFGYHLHDCGVYTGSIPNLNKFVKRRSLDQHQSNTEIIKLKESYKHKFYATRDLLNSCVD